MQLSIAPITSFFIRGRTMIRSEIMKCVANHTKVLEGVTREVREELASYHQKLISRKSNPRKQVTITPTN